MEVREGLDFELNPFNKDLSNMGISRRGEPLDLISGRSELSTVLLDIQKLIDSDLFPCVLGKAVRSSGEFCIGRYGNLADKQTAEAVCHDLLEFVRIVDLKGMSEEGKFRATSFSMAFEDELHSEEDFMRNFIVLIKNIHDLHEEHYGTFVPEGFSRDINSPNYGLILGNEAFFLAAFRDRNGISSERDSAGSVIVNFNSHSALNILKKEGKYLGIRNRIRENTLNNFGHVTLYLPIMGRDLKFCNMFYRMRLTLKYSCLF